MEPYWENRKDRTNYIREVLRLAREHVPRGGSVIDVGGSDCDYILWFDWFSEKTVLDKRGTGMIEGVENITCDFMDFEPGRPFDLVLCLQVLEHVKGPDRFAGKLLETGRTVIISVPYRWPKGECRGHRHDPVDEDKVLRWAGRQWKESTVVQDGAFRRFIAVFDGASRASLPHAEP